VSAREPRRDLVLPGIVTLMGLAVLIALGTWQLERKAWKEALIETMTRRFNAAPVELPPPDAWSRLTPENSEFLRVRLRINFRNENDVLVYTSGSALRDDVKSPGYFVFTPVRLADSERQIVINRGYVALPSYPGRAGAEEIIGYVRWPEAPSWFISSHDSPSATFWYVRDQRLMAEVKRWGDVAPFYIDQEAPPPPGGLPRPGPLSVKLRNDHLQYALTWYGLAAVLVVVFALWARGR
jgi:cytochrome oxidase assembly protein ShyY1